MSSLTLFTFILIALSCYVLSNSLKLQHQQMQLQHQATKKVDLPNPHQKGSPEHFAGEHQISHSVLNAENRQKRSQRGEYKDMDDIIEELQDNSLVQQQQQREQQEQAKFARLPAGFDVNNMSPMTYYMLVQMIKQLSQPTPMPFTSRLGRSIDFQLQDEDEVDQTQYMSRLMKKSVPFKPRLGKRGQMCD